MPAPAFLTWTNCPQNMPRIPHPSSDSTSPPSLPDTGSASILRKRGTHVTLKMGRGAGGVEGVGHGPWPRQGQDSSPGQGAERGEHSATLRHGACRLRAPGTLKPLAHTCPRNHLGSLCAGAVGLAQGLMERASGTRMPDAWPSQQVRPAEGAGHIQDTAGTPLQGPSTPYSLVLGSTFSSVTCSRVPTL